MRVLAVYDDFAIIEDRDGSKFLFLSSGDIEDIKE